MVDRLLDGAIELDIPAGQIIYKGQFHDEMVVLSLVVSGLLRVFMKSPEGRQVTIRYVVSGDVVGVPAVVAGGGPVDVQAVTACRLVRLIPDRFRALAATNVELSHAVSLYLAHRVFESSRLVAENVFFPVRARLARHLLDLAVRDNGGLVVAASQQDLADAIGSVREVVSRTLRAFREEGLVESARGGIVLPDPARLHLASQRQIPPGPMNDLR